MSKRNWSLLILAIPPLVFGGFFLSVQIVWLLGPRGLESSISPYLLASLLALISLVPGGYVVGVLALMKRTVFYEDHLVLAGTNETISYSNLHINAGLQHPRGPYSHLDYFRIHAWTGARQLSWYVSADKPSGMDENILAWLDHKVNPYEVATSFSFGDGGSVRVDCPHCGSETVVRRRIRGYVRCRHCGLRFLLSDNILNVL